ncbi:hypothetical protein LH128_05570 [Sphingomonas sp. LH128]|uniref:hypothetical protein n=1 Tax=Sphingomonas sp. LH128 TaxID=473781 RepID=UPI00027CA301|nr:hypothetical protein [Sphingomonas sp. LH128]EJU14071.1 hypothetical protein LH128_05570 [Sphingomonas sp. LH128]
MLDLPRRVLRKAVTAGGILVRPVGVHVAGADLSQEHFPEKLQLKRGFFERAFDLAPGVSRKAKAEGSQLPPPSPRKRAGDARHMWHRFPGCKAGEPVSRSVSAHEIS